MIDNIIRILDKYWMVFLVGLWYTIWIALVAVILGTVLGTLIAIVRMSKNKVSKSIALVYIEVIRGTPILLQFYLFWLGLPYIFPNISDLTSVLIALCINSSAYVAECVRAGIQAVDSGQREAALSLGLTERNIMLKVILPQAIKNILPALGNEFIVMIKETSIASIFFVGELMTAFKTVQSNAFLALEPLIIVGFIYLVITLTLSHGMKVVERRLNAND
ncbi:amino acid ABC transporter permease [Fusibacter ferrireducens]|uniref:Amino acid ABC transporter permease n=1 Tax=Fusibacter ferrireducens TaxID=2785058 RepID=A0ABR9ZUT2_9FIRM|nr:amino acid ABC transporter permease [Fusibacter ferrireducens]MBF4694193.1 amino acid ABC transporter permease [Fusibacter ferrireducens]